MLNKAIRVIVAMLALVVGAGCDGPELHDDIDLELDFGLTPSDQLHMPYVTGTQVTISATDGEDDERERSWTLTVDDPTVLRIDGQESASANCTAVRAGTTTLNVIEDGEVIHAATIEVADPDSWVMYPHGPIIVGLDAALRAPEASVLVGGQASFLVEYYRAGRRLYGNGVLSLRTTSDIEATPETTFLFENREWLQVTPRSEGDHGIELLANGRSIGGILIRAVGDDELASVELIHEQDVDFDEVEEGSELTVLGMARDAAGTPVYGVELSWDIDGDGIPGIGDLFRYQYEPDVHATLGGEVAGLRSEIRISGREGRVDSSNDLGCAAGRRGGSSLALSLAVAMVLALGLGLRRRTQRA